MTSRPRPASRLIGPAIFRSAARTLLGLGLAGVAAGPLLRAAAAPGSSRPNIVFLLADDLGYGDIGPFGQKKIHTPYLDQLAKEGMRLTMHYAGNNVCAPSRCVLLSGLHPGHAYVRDNRGHVGLADGKGGEGNEPVPAGALTLPLTLHRLGYAVGGFGKWGLGSVLTPGSPLKQGFDHFVGFNDQAVAHNYYPTYLWEDDHTIKLDNPAFSAHQKLPPGADPNDPASYARFTGRVYAPDVITDAALRFMRENRGRPFFLYYPTTVPHLALQVPEDSLKEYEGVFPEKPHTGDRGYLPNRTPRATYAAMITRMDRDIGKLLTQLEELGLRENTIVIFTSDNGPLYNELGGTDTEFFNSAGGLRGRKGSNYEGGIREPCIVRWPGHIAANSVSDRVTGFEDWLPTLLELTGQANEIPSHIDGVTFAPTLLGKAQPPRSFLYREDPGYAGQQSVREGNWKAIRTNLNVPLNKPMAASKFELYDLAADPGERRDVSAQQPDVVAHLTGIMQSQHAPSPKFPMSVLDGTPRPAKSSSD